MIEAVPLNELLLKVVDNRGRTCPTAEDGMPLIATNCVHNTGLYPTFEKIRRVDQATYENWFRGHPEPGDLIFVLKGTPGRVCLTPDPVTFCIAQDMVALRANPDRVDPRYLFAALRSPATQEAISNLHVGSMIAHFKKGDFNRLTIPLPERRAQENIGRFYLDLSKKIELNRRMSATLEELARALYRSWFVDFDPVHARALGQPPAHMDPTTAALFPDSFGEDGLPEGWEPGTLGDIAENVRQQVQPGKIVSDTPYIGLEHMPRRCIALSDWGDAGQVGSAKSAMRQGQILFGKLRPYFHKAGIVPTDGICSTDIVVLDAKAECWRELVLCIVSSDDFVDHTNASSAGTRMPRTSWKDMASYDIAVAPEEVAEAFSSMVRPMTAKIVACVHQARTLAALRDTLLPRLMSGELRIQEAEKQVEEVI